MNGSIPKPCASNLSNEELDLLIQPNASSERSAAPIGEIRSISPRMITECCKIMDFPHLTAGNRSFYVDHVLRLDLTCSLGYTSNQPKWRNWQTRATQNRVPSGVWVRLPPSASDDYSTASPFRIYRAAFFHCIIQRSMAQSFDSMSLDTR
jgi:hypothetical protein